MVKGSRHSEKARSEISKALKGRHHSEEAKKKVRKANMGKSLSRETKRKISDARLGSKLTEETKRKIGRSVEKSIQFIENKRGCFIVISHKVKKNGYVVLRRNYESNLIHRFIYEECFGFIPEGLCVCHTCDVRNCINPEHLFLGTSLDNSRDMVKKGRSARGEKQGAVKLTKEIVKIIREDKKSTHTSLARKYGVSDTAIRYVRLRRNWKHVA